MAENFLPYGKHHIDDDDIEAVVDVLRHGMLTCGPQVEKFEKAFADYVGAKEAVVCSNGTTALHLAVLASGIGRGDTAIVPSITFLATANAVRMAGGDVCFADVNPETGLMTLETLKEALKRAGTSVKAVMPVHMNGQADEMEAIHAFARDKGLKVITDCCHALGANYFDGGRPGDGRFEDFGTFSLHPVKSIAMGEGGMVTTNSPEAAAQLRMLRGHAMEKTPENWAHQEMGQDEAGGANPWYYEMQMLAYNYRATDIQCALGLSQLKKLPDFIAKRRQIADWYDAAFKECSNRIRPIERSGTCASAWHLYPVLIDFASVGKDRAAVMRELKDLGVGTQVHYVPVSGQPYYVDLYGEQDLPGTAKYYDTVLSIPIFPAMELADVQHVVGALKTVLSA